MTRLLLLGATGRTGSSVLRQLLEYEDIQVTAAIRNASDISRLPEMKQPFQTVVVDIYNPPSLRHATDQVDMIVNAIRIRGDTPPTALVTLDKRIREAVGDMEGRLIITVGGAGSFYMRNGKRFFQDSAFAERSLPRGVAHARLRDYLEEIPPLDSWTYLMPPPAYDPTGPRTGYYNQWDPSYDESNFLNSRISYEDFATAVCDAIREQWTGVHFIVGQESGN